VEAVCDKVVILNEGNPVAIGSCNQVKDKFGSGFSLKVTIFKFVLYISLAVFCCSFTFSYAIIFLAINPLREYGAPSGVTLSSKPNWKCRF
jgi:hypothetical protein